MQPQTILVKGERFVIIPEKEYNRLVKHDAAGGVDAVEDARRSISDGLRKAREAAGLTQTQLAKALSRSQAFVCAAEKGMKDVGERYVNTVLKACGLPADWKPEP